jgi:hypothetical protein
MDDRIVVSAEQICQLLVELAELGHMRNGSFFMSE